MHNRMVSNCGLLLAAAGTMLFCATAANTAHASYVVKTTASSPGSNWDYNFSQTGSSGSALPGYYASGTTDSTGLATAAVADAGGTTDHGGGVFTSSAEHGEANLATATSAVSENDTGFTTTFGGNDGGSCRGIFTDSVTFHIPGANGSTQTTVHLHWLVSGHMMPSGTNPDPGGPTGPEAALTSTFFVGSLASGSAVIALDNTQNGGMTSYVQSHSGSGSGGTGMFASATTQLIDFTCDFTMTGIDPVVSVNLSNELTSAHGMDSSYMSSLRFDVPGGVTMSSDSGVFMTQTPEPASPAVLAGIAGLFGCRRRAHLKK